MEPPDGLSTTGNHPRKVHRPFAAGTLLEGDCNGTVHDSPLPFRRRPPVDPPASLRHGLVRQGRRNVLVQSLRSLRHSSTQLIDKKADLGLARLPRKPQMGLRELFGAVACFRRGGATRRAPAPDERHTFDVTENAVVNIRHPIDPRPGDPEPAGRPTAC